SHSLPHPVTITILPCSDIVRTYKKFYPLAVFLQNEIGSKVIIQVPRDWDEFFRLISSGKTDFVYQPPHVYVQLEEHYNKSEILAALSQRGDRKHHGHLIVRSDSNISKVEDLRGKSVLFGHEFSMIKTLAGKALLQKHGMNYEKDLLEYRYGGSCEKIALNVYLRAADAGFVCNHVSLNPTSPPDKTWPFPPNSLKVIAETEECHTWIFSAVKSADASTVSAVIRALLSLHETQNHQGLLKDIESRGFAPILESDLLILRKKFL
ncbi:MAG: phosphate/phosphite/phosphonate ABC transporter substrate-binding protein, partial [Desulfobulbaceae bacterium]|nr:phosphate/phosphite/phosphonate ABC transporter substrate-binding protein [Desulfobulbaceae bacterium]